MYTLEEAREFYQVAKEAYLGALSNKSYDINGRSKSNHDIDKLKKEMNDWKDIVVKLEAGQTTGLKSKRVIPHV